MKRNLLIISTIIFLGINGFAQEAEKTFKAELDEFRGNMQKQMPKEAWDQGERIGNDMTETVIARGGMEKVLKVGKKIPVFTMNDAFGKPVSSKSLLKKGRPFSSFIAVHGVLSAIFIFAPFKRNCLKSTN